MKTCQTCAHSDNDHNDGSGELRECYVCASERENPKGRCTQFVDSGLDPCPFCGEGAWIIEAPSASGGDRVVYDAKCVNEECEASIEGCARKQTAKYLWNRRVKEARLSDG